MRKLSDLRIAVVGAYVADCLIDTPQLPSWEKTYEARSIRMSPGGKALNQAVALARPGAQVSVVGTIGNDALGNEILSALCNEGVETAGIQIRDGGRTPICACFASEDGRTSFIWHIDDALAAQPADIRYAISEIQRSDAVLITFEVPIPAIIQAIDIAHSGGAMVVVQPAPIPQQLGATLQLPWEKVDLLILNESEAQALLSARVPNSVQSSEDHARTLSEALGVSTVAITRGEYGCAVHSGGTTHAFSPAHADVVDATGAGDAFTAAFSLQVTAGATEADAARFALSAAAWAVAHAGSYESMPPYSAVDAHPPKPDTSD